MARVLPHVLLAIGLCCASFSSNAASTRDWKEYTYSSDGFAISAPTEPSISHDTRSAPEGVRERHVYQIYLNGGDVSLVVTVTAIAADDPRTPAQIFEDTKATAAHSLGANSTKSEPITLRSYPGIQFGLTTPKIRASLRYFLINHMLYQLGSVAPIDQQIAGETERWFNSFRPLAK